MSVRISTPRMTTEPSIRLWEERIFGLINSLTGLLTVLMAPRPSRELPPPQVPANWAVLRILAQSPLLEKFVAISLSCQGALLRPPAVHVESAHQTEALQFTAYALDILFREAESICGKLQSFGLVGTDRK